MAIFPDETDYYKEYIEACSDEFIPLPDWIADKLRQMNKSKKTLIKMKFEAWEFANGS